MNQQDAIAELELARLEWIEAGNNLLVVQKLVAQEIAAVQAKYAADVERATQERARAWSKYGQLRLAIDLRKAEAALPLPIGTVVEEWTSREYQKFLPAKEIQPKKTGRVGEIDLVGRDRSIRPIDGATTVDARVIVVLRLKSGKRGKRYVDYEAWNQRWIEEGKEWNDWKPFTN